MILISIQNKKEAALVVSWPPQLLISIQSKKEAALVVSWPPQLLISIQSKKEAALVVSRPPQFLEPCRQTLELGTHMFLSTKALSSQVGKYIRLQHLACTGHSKKSFGQDPRSQRF